MVNAGLLEGKTRRGILHDVLRGSKHSFTATIRGLGRRWLIEELKESLDAAGR
jgi:hypothetical protein